VFNATQSIEHAFGADIGIKQAQRHIAAKRRIRGFEPTDCGGSVVKDFIRAADNPSQAPNLGRFFAVQSVFVPLSASAAWSYVYVPAYGSLRCCAVILALFTTNASARSALLVPEAVLTGSASR